MNVAAHTDRWSIEVQGGRVQRAAFDWAVTLTIGSPRK